MKSKIEKRILEEANYMIKTNKTIREVAKIFNVSKSTVHKDLKEKLKKIDLNTYKKVEKIINHHIKIRHIKGGEATRKKYQKKITKKLHKNM